jgi:RNA polymerase sigma factor (sigma-70 family)
MPAAQRNQAVSAITDAGGGSEESLVARLKAGDGAAAREFFDSYATRIHRFIASSLGGDAREAEDLLQETFIALAEALPFFRGDCSLFTFACAIAHRKVQSFIRRNARRARIALAAVREAPEESGDYESESSSNERRAVADAMAHLPEDYREVLILKYVEELSVSEMARVMQLSEHAIESRLARARRGLRAILEASR